jgi:ABC-2 type transport system permease protein
MRRSLEILRFELRQQATSASNYFFFLVFAALGALVTLAVGSNLQELVSRAETPLLANAPYTVTLAILNLSGLALFALSGGLFGRSATRDFDAGSFPILLTSGVVEREFVVGRLVAATIVAVLISLGIVVGLLVGLVLPPVVPDHVGPLRWQAYAMPVLVYVIPNCVIFGTLLFAVGLLGRRTLWVYLALPVAAAVVSLVATAIGPIARNVGDPLGSLPQLVDTWTPLQKNTESIPITPELIANRVFWLAMALVGAALLARQFRYADGPLTLPRIGPSRRTAAAGPPPPDAAPAIRSAGAGAVSVVPSFGRVHSGPLARASQLWSVTRFELGRALRDKLLWPVVLGAIVLSVASAGQVNIVDYGLSTWPVTRHMFGSTDNFPMVLTLMLVFLLGEAIWRERDTGMAGLTDTSQAPNWVFFLGKLLAMLAVAALALVVLMLAIAVGQLVLGPVQPDLGPMLVQFFTLQLPRVAVLLVPVVLVHALVTNKYVGHFVSVLVVGGILLLTLLLPNLLREFGQPHIWLPGYTPTPTYTDMNGFGRFLTGVRWYQAYWLALAIVVLLLVQLVWPRGAETAVRGRLRAARAHLSRGPAVALAGALAVAAALGGFIYYQTQVVNRAQHHAYLEEQEAILSADADPDQFVQRYVSTYAPYADAQPTLVAVHGDFDLRPDQHALGARLQYTLENRTGGPVGDVLVNDRAVPALTDVRLDRPDATSTLDNVGVARVYHFRLDRPLAPGEQVRLLFAYQTSAAPGFGDSAGETDLVDNGTRLLSDNFLPRLGYVPLVRPEDSPDALRRYTALGVGQDVLFDGTINTASDQTAFLPGTLERDWLDGDRHYYTYRTRDPIRLQFFVVSGRYAVERAQHGDVALEVYYHPEHAFNVQRQLDALGTALDVYGAAFGPIGLHQLRYVETPAYESVAVSTPGTIVAAEGMGFVSKVTGSPGSVDYPSYIVAHETGHQWWGLQVAPANADGAYLILETMTQYSALLTMERLQGPEGVRTFLQYELNKYLQSRGTSDVPLAQTRTNKDQYVYYNKGAVVMYTLKDYLGEETLNAALARFIQRFRSGPPYPLASDLLDAIRAATPADRQYLLTDLLETITL